MPDECIQAEYFSIQLMLLCLFEATNHVLWTLLWSGLHQGRRPPGLLLRLPDLLSWSWLMFVSGRSVPRAPTVPPFRWCAPGPAGTWWPSPPI